MCTKQNSGLRFALIRARRSLLRAAVIVVGGSRAKRAPLIRDVFRTPSSLASMPSALTLVGVALLVVSGDVDVPHIRRDPGIWTSNDLSRAAK